MLPLRESNETCNGDPFGGHYPIQMQSDLSMNDDLAVATERMKRLARALVGNAHDAEDVAQDAWCQALRPGSNPRDSNPRDSNPRDSSPRDSDAWLNGVARNVARHHRRASQRRRRRESVAARSEGQAPDQLALDHLESVHTLIEVVRSLPQPYRSALVLQYVVGMAPTEAAEALGVGGATLRSRVRRGLKLVRKELRQRAEKKQERWQSLLAPLVGDAAAITAGGMLVSKASSFAGALLLLLSCAGVATLWLFLADTEEGPKGRATAEDVTTKATQSSPPGLEGHGVQTAQQRSAAAPVRKSESELGALAVFVFDRGGAALPGARVMAVRDTQRDKDAAAALTGPDGVARFEGLPAGGYTARVQKDGFTARRKSTVVNPASPARVNVTLAPAIVVRGRVVRAADGVPIAGARVFITAGGSAGGRTVIRGGAEPTSVVKTGTDGRFRLQIAAERIATLHATAAGMAEAKRSLLLSGPGDEIELRLRPGGTITGRVRTLQGDPCPGARVFAVPADQPRLIANPRLVLSSSGSSFYTNTDDGGGSAEFEGEDEVYRAHRAITDEEGRYELVHLSLLIDVRILVEGPTGARGGTGVLALDVASPHAVADVSLEARGILRVQVLDPEGKPKTNASVVLEGVSADDEGLHFLEPRGEGSWSDYVGAHGGVFQFAGLSVGAYVVVVKGPAGDEVRTPVEILKGGAHDVTVHVRAARIIAGVVVDEQGRPIPGAEVRLGGTPHKADDEGRFRIEGSGDPGRVLEASARWHLHAQVVVPTQAKPVRLVLKKRPVVTGILVPPEGGESLRDHIWVVEHTSEGSPSRAGVVDPKGRFRFPLNREEQDVQLLLLPRGAADVLLGPFNLSAGEERDVGRVALDLGRSVQGSVVDEQGHPVSGANVRVGRPGLLDLRDGMFVSAPQATTSADGAFQIGRVHRGHFAIRVRHGSHAPVVLEDPPGRDLKIVLSPGSFLEGIVRGPDGEPRAGLHIVARREMPRLHVPGISARTDEQGHFRIGPLPAGEHPLTTYRGLERVDLGTVMVRQGETAVCNLTLP